VEAAPKPLRTFCIRIRSDPKPSNMLELNYVGAKFSPVNCIKPDTASDPTISYTHKIQDFGEKKNSLN
jgi:hypothetical protein